MNRPGRNPIAVESGEAQLPLTAGYARVRKSLPHLHLNGYRARRATMSKLISLRSDADGT